MGKNIETAASAAAMGGMGFDRRPSRRSRLSPDALMAAAVADEIPVEGKWRPGSSLLFIVFGSAVLWIGVLALGVALVR